MTTVKFIGKPLDGFMITGHSTKDADDESGKLVCSAISSAAYLVANTITDVFCDRADISLSDGEFSLRLRNPSEKSSELLEGFRLHAKDLAEQYHENITIISEV